MAHGEAHDNRDLSYAASELLAEDPTLTSDSERRLNDLGYRSEFRRDMSLFGVLGISFCAIGILTGMSSAFQTGLFSGGPLGLFWGWNVGDLVVANIRHSFIFHKICSIFMLLIALSLAEICSA